VSAFGSVRERAIIGECPHALNWYNPVKPTTFTVVIIIFIVKVQAIFALLYLD